MVPLVGQYEMARPFINDGDIVFVSNNSLFSKIIRWVTKSKYSHVGIAFKIQVNGEERLMIVEHQGCSKRRMINLSYYQNKNLDIIAAPRDWSEYADIALEDLGEADYSWLEAIYVGIREFFLRYLKIKLPYLNFPGEICSEYVARLLKLDQIHISPETLFEKLEEKGHSISIQVRK